MKNSVILFLTMVVLPAFFASCATVHYREITPEEVGTVNVVSTIEVVFWSRLTEAQIRSRALAALEREAHSRFGNNVEIRNIRIVHARRGSSAGLGIIYSVAGGLVMAEGISWEDGLLKAMGAPLIGTGIYVLLAGLGLAPSIVVAGGDVIVHGARTGIPRETVTVPRPDANITMHGPGEALSHVAGTLINTIPQDATIAILNLRSDDPDLSEFIMTELEYRLFRSRRFTIVDRLSLDHIREEQHLHISGEVDDSSAVSIGNLLGAGIVITGDIGTDLMGSRLLFRALDVRTGQVVAMALGRF